MRGPLAAICGWLDDFRTWLLVGSRTSQEAAFYLEPARAGRGEKLIYSSMENLGRAIDPLYIPTWGALFHVILSGSKIILASSVDFERSTS